MTTIDGTRAAGTITLPGATLDRLDDLGRILGRSPAELVTLAIATYAPALVTPAPQFTTPVDAGATRRQLPGDGRGTAGNPPPAVPVLWPVDVPYCTKSRTCNERPSWTFTNPSMEPWDGEACCDAHIPPGWRKPAAVPAHAHLDGGPCVYGDRCDQ